MKKCFLFFNLIFERTVFAVSHSKLINVGKRSTLGIKRYFLLFTFYFLLFFANAQTQFFSTVKIEYEKTVAQHALMKELAAEWYESAKDYIPANSVSYFDFIADSAHSIYKPGRDNGNTQRNWFTELGAKNIVYTDYQ